MNDILLNIKNESKRNINVLLKTEVK